MKTVRRLLICLFVVWFFVHGAPTPAQQAKAPTKADENLTSSLVLTAEEKLKVRDAQWQYAKLLQYINQLQAQINAAQRSLTEVQEEIESTTVQILKAHKLSADEYVLDIDSLQLVLRVAPPEKKEKSDGSNPASGSNPSGSKPPARQ